MKKVLKITLFTALCLITTFALTACGSNNQTEENNANMANPMVESTQQGVCEATGIDLPAPDKAQNIEYFYINTQESEPIAELRFTLEDRDYALRAQMTDITDYAVSDEEIQDLAAGNEKESILGDISGLNYEWETFSSMDVQYCDARCYGCSKAAFVAWVDVAPGVLYNLSTTPGMDCAELCNTASKVFVPLQGEN